MIKKLQLCATFVVFIVLRTAPLSAANLVTPANPESAWSGSYLVNYAFISEYTLLWKGDQPADLDVMIQPTGLAFWKRAFFATEAMKARSQDFSDHKNIAIQLDQHFLLLQKAHPEIGAEREQIRLAAVLQAEGTDQATSDAGFMLVEQSLAHSRQQELFRDLRSLYFADEPSCPISARDVKEFADHQKNLQVSGRAINGNQLISSLKDWSLKKVRCLVFALMGTPAESKDREGSDPLPLMLTFQQMSSPLARDMSFKSVYAIRLLQTDQYAETLRTLFELADLQPGFHLPYEMVQRIFSIRQKGDGQVALKGI